ncbi:MAG TPA: cupredoxin domain-containing protein [Pedococcus sp.]|nr:cupredoxin domain-containing protein [Pedococcus sp.]
MRMRAAGYRLAVVTAVAVVAAGCGGSGRGGSGSSSSSAASSPAASSPSSPASGTPLTVVEKEYSITPSKTSLPPGTYTFQISNEGKFAHNLTVSGPAVSAAASPEIVPGQSGQLTLTLMKGSYELWCSIDGHKDLGMDIHLAVG